MVSGLFNASYALGGVIGPLYGGYLTEATSFNVTADTQAAIMFTLATLNLTVVFIPSQLKARRMNQVTPKDQEDEDQQHIEYLETSPNN